MSLQQLAQTVQSRGRNGDSVLIHMTPGEVQGLQSLAMAAGGSLTVNPDTGLPEANFLKSLLPTLLGAGLSFIPGVGPLMAAGIVGGGTALASGNLQKGLMAGLGAYGGAGLAGGLVGAGAGAAQQAAIQGVQGAAAGAAPAGIAGMPAFDPIAGAMINTPDAARIASQAAMNKAAAQATMPYLSPDVAAEVGRNLGMPATQTVTQMPIMDQLGAGAKAAFNDPKAFVQGLGGPKAAARFGLAALSPMAAMEPTTRKPVEEVNPYSYAYDPGRVENPDEQYAGAYSGEREYFRPTFTRMAEGGSVEEKFPMTGASKETFDYLMGRSAQSPQRQMAMANQAAMEAAPVAAPAPVSAAPSAAGLFGARTAAAPALAYAYDPVTQRFTEITPPEPVRSASELMGRRQMGSGGGLRSMGFGGYGDRGPGGSSGESGASAGGAGPGGPGGYAKGGITGLASGGFVVPADVVSMLGEGSTDAGIRSLQNKYGPAIKPIKGPGTGQSDSIPATIEGKQRARVADGEVYIPPEVVAKHGGSKKFYNMLNRVRAASQGHTKQQRRINPDRVMA